MPKFIVYGKHARKIYSLIQGTVEQGRMAAQRLQRLNPREAIFLMPVPSHIWDVTQVEWENHLSQAIPLEEGRERG